jgi:hypothetical protein
MKKNMIIKYDEKIKEELKKILYSQQGIYIISEETEVNKKIYEMAEEMETKEIEEKITKQLKKMLVIVNGILGHKGEEKINIQDEIYKGANVTNKNNYLKLKFNSDFVQKPNNATLESIRYHLDIDYLNALSLVSNNIDNEKIINIKIPKIKKIKTIKV